MLYYTYIYIYIYIYIYYTLLTIYIYYIYFVGTRLATMTSRSMMHHYPIVYIHISPGSPLYFDYSTPDLPTNFVGFRGLDSSILLI